MVDAITESWVQVQGDSIVAIALSVPVYTSIRNAHNQTVNSLTGNHQSICIIDMRY